MIYAIFILIIFFLIFIRRKVLSNIIIKYPFNNIEIFQKKGNPDNVQLSGIDVTEILPIVAELKFNGEYDADPIQINLGDKLVDVFFDDRQNAVPIVLECMKFKGNFFGKNMVSKQCDLSLHRGPLPTEIKDLVDEYISNVVETKKQIRSERF